MIYVPCIKPKGKLFLSQGSSADQKEPFTWWCHR